MMRSTIALASAAIAVCGLVACGPDRVAGDGCTPDEREVTRELEGSAVLDLAPPGAKKGEPYAKMPCEDEGGVGEVGRQLSTADDRESTLSFYRSELPERGWNLAREQEQEPGRSNGDGPHQCYENPAVAGVVLVVLVGHGENPATDFHLTFRFTADRTGGYACADNYRP